MRYILVIILLLSISNKGTSMPLSPVSLPFLIDQSDIIALVEVDSLDRWERSNDGLSISSKSNATAFLSVTKVFKGKIASPKLEIGYMGNLTCPTPPSFNKSDKTIVFLSKDSISGTYSVFRLSYGTKIMNNPNRLEAYEQAIESYLKLEMSEEENKIRAWHIWLKNCLQNKYLIDEIDYLFRNISQNKEAIVRIQQEYEKHNFDAELLKVFVKRKIREIDDLAIINFLPKNQYPIIKDKLVKSLKSDPYNDYLNYFLMNKLIEYQKNKKKTKDIAEKYYSKENFISYEDFILDDDEPTSKEDILIIHKRMDLLLNNFIRHLK